MRQSLRSSINAVLDVVGVQARPAGRLPSKAWSLCAGRRNAHSRRRGIL